MATTKTYHGAEPVRVNKWLAQEGVCSRREAEALLADGQVSIDGVVVREPGAKIAAGQTLTLAAKGGAELAAALTFVLNKPVGYVSAQPDPGQIPAARLLVAANAAQAGAPFVSGSLSLAPLGRLDMDSRGLLLLSTDGVLTKAVIGPESKLTKSYEVYVEGRITADKIDRLRHGMTIDGRTLKRAEVEAQGQWLFFTLQEGRNRQIRRMCQAVNLDVFDLYRTRIGPLHIDDLAEGKWRLLRAEERAAIIAASKG
jgi:23S rRNA pseudouridine2604 synthase